LLLKTPSPLIIYGPKKSGSTLIQQLLDGHESIFMLPGEFNSYKYIYSDNIENKHHLLYEYLHHSNHFIINPDPDIWGNYSVPKMWNNKEYYFKKNDEYKFSSKQLPDVVQATFDLSKYKSMLLKKLKNINNPSELLEIEACCYSCAVGMSLEQKKYLGYKQVGNYAGLVKKVNSNDFDAKIIIIVRDPRGILNSRINSDRNNYKFKTSMLRKFKVVNGVVRFYQEIDYLKASDVYKKNVKIVHYEDLVSNSESIMMDICEFLEIDFSPDMLKASVLGIQSAVRTDSRQEKETSNKVFVSSIESWKNQLSKSDILLSNAFIDNYNENSIIRRYYHFSPLSKIFSMMIKVFFTFKRTIYHIK